MSRVRVPGPGRTALLAVAALSLLVLGACASQTRFDLRCDSRVNDGLLLTIDLVQVTEEEARQIQQLGGEWFYSDLRRQLSLRTKTVAVEGGCNQQVVLQPEKKMPVLAVISDYRGQTQATFKRGDEWRGKRLQLQIHDTHLTVERG